jgi:hypothetical protein
MFVRQRMRKPAVTRVMVAFLMGDLTGLAGLLAGLAAAAAGGFTGGIATLGPTLVFGMPFDSDAFRSNFGLGCHQKKIRTENWWKARK